MNDVMGSGYNLSDFARGMEDCRDGISQKENQGRSYDAGYGAKYQMDEVNSKQAEMEQARCR